MTCGQSTAPRSSRFDHRAATKPVSCNEDLPASLADAAALDSRRNLKPGRQKSLQVPRGHLLGCLRWTVLEDGPSLRTGNRIFRRQVWCCHHPWRRALTQCRARYHISIHLAMADPYASSFLSARGLISACPFGRQTHAGLYPGLPCGERTLLLALVWLCGLRRTERSGVDTTHRPGGSHTLSSTRATRFPNPPDFWSVARHRFNGVAMTELAVSGHPFGCSLRLMIPAVRPCGSTAGGCTL